MDFTWEEYQKKLETYRKNRENVPLETLKTKYAKGYNKLKSDLKKMTEERLGHVDSRIIKNVHACHRKNEAAFRRTDKKFNTAGYLPDGSIEEARNSL